jgi:hypothetical protein
LDPIPRSLRASGIQVAFPAPHLRLIVVGFAYLALSFTGLMLPAYEHKVWKFAQPVLFGEVAIMLWLAIMGAKETALGCRILSVNW